MMDRAKKVLACALAVIMAASAMSTSAFSVFEPDAAVLTETAPETDGAEYTDGTFTVDDKGVLTGYSGSGGDVVIPSKVNGKAVTSIGSTAFNRNDTITTVSIPDSVSTIGNYAFSGCKSLLQADIGKNVTELGIGVFEGCTKLVAVTLGDALETIGDRAFYGCTYLSAVEFGKKLKTIGSYSFSFCTGLGVVELPDSLTVIGNHAFASDSGIVVLTFGSNLTTIGESAFEMCSSIMEVLLPDSVTELGIKAFFSCTKLTSVKLPVNLKVIKKNAFSRCTALGNVTIPSGVTEIEAGAFDSCKPITELTLPDGLRIIGDSAFKGISIKKLVIPDSVTKFGSGSFGSCTSLVNVTLGSGIVALTDDPFTGSTKLVTLHIDKSLRSVNNDAFKGCKDIIEIYYSGTCAEWNSFASLNSQSFLASASSKFTVYCSDGEVAGENAVKKTVKSITIIPPLKTEYLQGEELDLTGGKIEVVFSKGEPLITDITAEMVSGFNKDKKGKQTITVKYEGKKGTFIVNVSEKPEDYTLSGVKLNGEPVKDFTAAVKAIGNDEGTFTITVDAPITVKSLSFPKNAALIIESAGEGSITTSAASIAPKNDLTIRCPISVTGGKTLSVKCAKNSTLTVDTGSKFGTISGAKGSKLVMNTTAEAETIKSFDEINTGSKCTLFVTKAMSGAAIGTASMVWDASAAKKISVTAVSGTLTLTILSEPASGDIAFMYAGKEPLDRKKVILTNKADGKQLEAFVYKKEVRAEIPDLMKLGGSNCPSWEYALLQMTDAEAAYTVDLTQDMSIPKFALPAKAASLTINGNGHTLDLVKTKTISAKYPLTLNELVITAGELPVSIKTGKTDVTLNNSSVGAVTTGGRLTLTGSVIAAGAVSAGELAASAAKTHITLQSLAVTANGITDGTSPITVKFVDKKTGEPLQFKQDEKKDVVVVKTFKLPKDGEYKSGSLVLDKLCGTDVLVFYKNKLIIPKPPKEE